VQRLPDPDELRARLAVEPSGLRQSSFTVRVGSAGPDPVTVRLDAGPVVLRADEETAAAVATWVVAQLAAGHDDRELCLAAAIAPTPTRTWLGLNGLPQARPSSPPLSGPHVATSAEAAADLLDRVRALVRSRAELDATGPSVVAVLDARLGARPDDPTL